MTPLNPDSAEGRVVADRLSRVLAEIRAEIARRDVIWG